jgi:hypothetical protein
MGRFHLALGFYTEDGKLTYCHPGGAGTRDRDDWVRKGHRKADVNLVSQEVIRRPRQIRELDDKCGLDPMHP